MSDNCQHCGKPVGPRSVDGLCPECLLKVGLDTLAPEGARAFEPPPLDELRERFPQFEIIELLGRGGMGVVYKARQRRLDRLVALKLLPPEIGADPAFAQRFEREARALAKLNHPNIVTLYEFGESDGLYYFLMEYVDGASLRLLLQSGRVAPREALAIVPQICDALQYAHDRGIVHRDIKPENILLDRQGRVKVADFGLAKLVRSSDPTDRTDPAAPSDHRRETTHASLLMGTPQYMAPEQCERPAEVDHRADIYSLGVVFYQMLTGELPKGDFAPPSKKVVVDVRLDEVVLRALEKKPELRYQQVSEVKAQIQTIATTRPWPARTDARRPTPDAERPPVQPPSDWWHLPLAASLLLYAAFVAFLFFTASSLPGRVASHFGANGQPNGWMSRTEHIWFLSLLPLAIGALFAGIVAMTGKLPASLINIPRKDYWLTPERRALTASLLGARLAWFYSLLLGFFAGLHALTLAANRAQPVQLPMEGLLLLVMGFLIATMIWTILLITRFAEVNHADVQTPHKGTDFHRQATDARVQQDVSSRALLREVRTHLSPNEKRKDVLLGLSGTVVLMVSLFGINYAGPFTMLGIPFAFFLFDRHLAFLATTAYARQRGITLDQLRSARSDAKRQRLALLIVVVLALIGAILGFALLHNRRTTTHAPERPQATAAPTATQSD